MAEDDFKMKNGWALLEALGNPPLTNEMIEKWEQEDCEEQYRRAFFPQSDFTQS